MTTLSQPKADHRARRHRIRRDKNVDGRELASEVVNDSLSGLRHTAGCVEDQQQPLAEIMAVDPGHEAVDVLHVDRRKEPRDLGLL